MRLTTALDNLITTLAVSLALWMRSAHFDVRTDNIDQLSAHREHRTADSFEFRKIVAHIVLLCLLKPPRFGISRCEENGTGYRRATQWFGVAGPICSRLQGLGSMS